MLRRAHTKKYDNFLNKELQKTSTVISTRSEIAKEQENPEDVLTRTFSDIYKNTGRTDHLLTLTCKLQGQPYSLKYYPQFKPMFNLKAAPFQVWQCARQVGKSENLTASRYLRGRLRDNYSTLMVCPRFEQTRRLSVDKAAPLMKNSMPGFFYDNTCVQRALERELINGNKVQYSHCYTGPDASRGFSVNGICYDETQDIVLSYADVIDQCMSGSKIYYDKLYSGTAKETTGTLTVKFNATSQGFWAVRCMRCNKWSIASDEIDSSGLYAVERMIGSTGPRCLYCGKDLEDAPLRGQYVHKYANRVGTAEGYHVPQVIHYAHWGSINKWNVLLDYYRGNALLNKEPLPRVTFVNEILGLPLDSEEMLIKPAEIERVSKEENTNDLTEALKRSQQYSRIILSVDWSGFGDESASSHTAVCIIGELKNSGHPEVMYMERLSKSAGPLEQIRRLGEIWQKGNFFAFVHDGCGAGMQQELLLIKAGIIPAKKVVAMIYVDAPVRKFVCEKSTNAQRRGLSLDKTRSLLMLFLMFQRRKGYLPNYKQCQPYTNDFLAIYRDTRSNSQGASRMRILKKAGKSDDFVHCVNYGFTFIWYRRNEYHKLHLDTLLTKDD